LTQTHIAAPGAREHNLKTNSLSPSSAAWALFVVMIPIGSRTMQTLSAEETKVRRLIEAARSAPVLVLDDGEPAAVVLSPSEFARLEEGDRIQREAKARLRKTMSLAQAEAAEKGLTEEDLERLLADES
jgi:PHD/YefM family antitoxin component YafN of YafNO toxin-antitoxin module